jgi:Domain of unknown function (DUF4189)
MRGSVIVSLLALAAFLMGNDRANSEGAIVVGIAPGGVANGFAIRFVVGRPSKEIARAEALAACKKPAAHVASGALPNDSNARARARCEVVATFSNKCAAVAVDPKDGTPGVGWATGDTQEQADKEALARCQSTAGADRRDFCRVGERHCDGTAK